MNWDFIAGVVFAAVARGVIDLWTNKRSAAKERARADESWRRRVELSIDSCYASLHGFGWFDMGVKLDGGQAAFDQIRELRDKVSPPLRRKSDAKNVK